MWSEVLFRMYSDSLCWCWAQWIYVAHVVHILCVAYIYTPRCRRKCAWPCLSFSFLSFVNVSRLLSTLVAWPVSTKFFFNLLPWMWLRAQEKHAFRLTSKLLSTHTRSFLLFITNREVLCRENKLHAWALHCVDSSIQQMILQSAAFDMPSLF